MCGALEKTPSIFLERKHFDTLVQLSVVFRLKSEDLCRDLYVFSCPPCKIPEAHSGANNGQKYSDSNKQYRACAYLTGWVLISVVEPKLEKKTAGSGLLGADQQSAERSSLKKTVICLTSQCLTCIIFWIGQENNLN